MTQSIKKSRIVVLISGNGSNLQAIMDAVASGRINSSIGLVVSNRSTAFGLTRASSAGIPIKVLTLKSFKDQGKARHDYDRALASLVLDFMIDPGSGKPQIDLVVLAGFMHILSPEFLNSFDHKTSPSLPKSIPIINLHPALPKAFDGANAIGRAFDSFQKREITKTGVMVHRVIAEVDRGDVVLVRDVAILPGDSLKDLEDRIHAIEHVVLVEAVQILLP